ncbi:MAG: hypothetical protein ACLFVQ_13475 [Chitinispirillaceae bacterium]
MPTKTKLFFCVLFVLLLKIPSAAQTYLPLGGRFYIMAEYGFLDVVTHTGQFSESGSEIDYVAEGGQENLYPFLRLALRFDVAEKHKFSILYQPLSLVTQETTDRDLLIDEQTFPADTPVKFVYDFPFYRAGYLYSFTEEDSPLFFGAGAALQIRNANIQFQSLDGTLLRTNRDVGLVPLLKLAAGYRVTDYFWIEALVDGIYAPIRYLNLSDTDVEGALVDANLRGVFTPQGFAGIYANVRYLAGGAEGTGETEGPGDGFVSNWLQFITVSLGFTLYL